MKKLEKQDLKTIKNGNRDGMPKKYRNKIGMIYVKVKANTYTKPHPYTFLRYSFF